MKTLPNPGTYLAKLAGAMVVYLTEQTQSLCVAIPVELTSGDVAWQGKYTVTIAKGDGELMLKNGETLAKVFGVDMSNPFNLEAVDPAADLPFEIVGEHSEFTPTDGGETRTNFKIEWLNPVGGSTKMPAPVEAADRKAILAKFGGKFKASFGGKPSASTAKPAAAKQPAQQELAAPAAKAPAKAPARSAAGGPPGRNAAAAPQARVSTQQDVWDALVKANPDTDEAALGNDTYWPAIDGVAPGSNGELTPAQWGEVADKLGL